MEKGKRKNLRSVSVLAVLDIFLIVLVCVSVSFWQTEERRYEWYNKQPALCVSCSDLALHPDDSPNWIDFKENKTECCPAHRDNISSVVDLYTRQWFKNRLFEENPTYQGCKEVVEDKKYGNTDEDRNNPKREYIKVSGYQNLQQNATHHRRVHWDNSTVLSSSNMHYAHGFITVGVGGMFKVYSQVVIDYNKRRSDMPRTPNLSLHGINFKQNYPGAEERHVTSTTLSQCMADPENSYIVSHIETVYQFQAGDKVTVKVSYPEDIVANPTMNFFGIHMI